MSPYAMFCWSRILPCLQLTTSARFAPENPPELVDVRRVAYMQVRPPEPVLSDLRFRCMTVGLLLRNPMNDYDKFTNAGIICETVIRALRFTLSTI
ncbi:hypothetical protein CCHR01_15167 [Colletotrichum chrysophilum]|uniref:Secreted protein n=1 Tax=Colletotrichum chrysophilum TaxID=1836956 RepID=A0AAD9E8X4_9PEZI|nr:hypothetical protein CCHR01_15167 [Colletotrichum chrysophilum]